MKTKNIKCRFNIIAVIAIIIISVAIAPKTLQNDTFYTIKIGEYILENGLTMKDPFSWHEGLKYTYPHWLYDVIIYLFYSIGGQAGIYISTIIFTIILGLILYNTNCKFTKNRLMSFIITVGIIVLMRDYIAARAQLVTFSLFILTVYCIEMFLKTKKKRYAIGLIVIPILLANLHIAVFCFYFVLYLPYIGEYIMAIISEGTLGKNLKIRRLNKKLTKIKDEYKIEKINQKKQKLQEKIEKNQKIHEKREKNAYKIIITKNDNVKLLIVIMIICLFAGLISPLGVEPYTYLYKTMKGNTTQSISEHLPLTLINEVDFACILILFIAILMFTDTKIKLSDLFMLGGLLLLSFITRRQISLFLIICGPIFNKLICALLEKYSPGESDIAEKNIATRPTGIIITLGLSLIVALLAYKPHVNAKYIAENTYPIEASEYILNNLDVNNIKLFNEYNYGSYLLFKGIPVFIDSRADLYTPEFNEGKDIFSDYINISSISINNIEDKFNEYGITHLILYNNSKLKIYIEAKEDKYNEIYKDNYFSIYERNK